MQNVDADEAGEEAKGHCLPVVIACVGRPVGVVDVCFTNED
jgi:hypothetical protein